METIGDSYMVVSGLPVVFDCHAAEMAKLALELLDTLRDQTFHKSPVSSFQLRVGLHTGRIQAPSQWTTHIYIIIVLCSD